MEAIENSPLGRSPGQAAQARASQPRLSSLVASRIFTASTRGRSQAGQESRCALIKKSLFSGTVHIIFFSLQARGMLDVIDAAERGIVPSPELLLDALVAGGQPRKCAPAGRDDATPRAPLPRSVDERHRLGRQGGHDLERQQAA